MDDSPVLAPVISTVLPVRSGTSSTLNWDVGGKHSRSEENNGNMVVVVGKVIFLL